jgi:hypothetical protein
MKILKKYACLVVILVAAGLVLYGGISVSCQECGVGCGPEGCTDATSCSS